MRKLKVFGTITPFGGHKVVAAHSKKEAAAIFGVSMYEFNGYCHETGNDEQINAAMSDPGQAFMKRPEDEAYRPVDGCAIR